MIGPSAVDEAVEGIAARHCKRHVGPVVGAVTSAGRGPSRRSAR